MSIPKLLYRDGTPMRSVKLSEAAKEIYDEAIKVCEYSGLRPVEGYKEESSPQDPDNIYVEMSQEEIDRMNLEEFDRMLEMEETDEERAYRKGYMDGYEEGLYDGQYK